MLAITQPSSPQEQGRSSPLISPSTKYSLKIPLEPSEEDSVKSSTLIPPSSLSPRLRTLMEGDPVTWTPEEPKQESVNVVTSRPKKARRDPANPPAPRKKKTISSLKSTPYSDWIASTHETGTYEEALHRKAWDFWTRQVECEDSEASQNLVTWPLGNPSNFTWQRWDHIARMEFFFQYDALTEDPGWNFYCPICKMAKVCSEQTCSDCKMTLRKLHRDHFCMSIPDVEACWEKEDCSFDIMQKAAIAGAILARLPKKPFPF